MMWLFVGLSVLAIGGGVLMVWDARRKKAAWSLKHLWKLVECSFVDCVPESDDECVWACSLVENLAFRVVRRRPESGEVVALESGRWDVQLDSDGMPFAIVIHWVPVLDDIPTLHGRKLSGLNTVLLWVRSRLIAEGSPEVAVLATCKERPEGVSVSESGTMKCDGVVWLEVPVA